MQITLRKTGALDLSILHCEFMAHKKFTLIFLN
jgi:hypothetical protein